MGERLARCQRLRRDQGPDFRLRAPSGRPPGRRFRLGAIPVALAGPTRVHITGPRVAIEPTNLRVGGGRLAVRGTLAPSGSDLQLELAGLPLSLIDAFAPGTNLDGTLQAKLSVRGS